MIKNITLTAEEFLVKKARQKAEKKHTSLNSEFRLWLRQYVQEENIAADYESLMRSLKHISAGHKFSREQMNAR